MPTLGRSRHVNLSGTTGLSVRGLGVDYGGGEVVCGVDLNVTPGKILALVGPNGAGKTSALSSIAGLAPRSRGTVHVDGRGLDPLSPDRTSRRGLMLVPDDRGLFPGLNVYEHLRLGAHHKPTPEEMEEVGASFPVLLTRLKQPAGSLSGGEAQMLSIAMALLSRPTVLLIDELSFGLAPLIVNQLLERCRALADTQQLALVIVEQYIDLALEVADEAVVLVRGVSALTGPAADLRGRTDDIYSAYVGQRGV